MGRRRQGNSTPQKNNSSIKDLVGKENENPVLDPNRMMIKITREPSYMHKTSLKEEIMDELFEILMEKLQKMVKQNIQDELKQYQHTTNKKT
jgi:hypothetical protein